MTTPASDLMKKQRSSLKGLHKLRGYDAAAARQQRSRTAEAIRGTFTVIRGGLS